MKSYSLTHLSDSTLAHDMAAMVAGERIATAGLLAHLAEFDARRLYLPAAHPSMYSYCVHELGLSEDSAFKRIRAARAARRFPAIFEAVAAGHLSLGAVVLLAPHLTGENADELLTAAARKSKSQIEQVIAERFPRPDVPARVRVLSAPPALGPGMVEQLAPGPVETLLGPGQVEGSAAGWTDLKPKLAPLAPQRFALQLTVSQEVRDKLRYAQELLSHQISQGDVAQVLERALDALIPQLEKRKFARTNRPRRSRSTTSARHVPAHVKRAVWERDGGRCTFVSDNGHRCPARKFLEFDHVEPVARGGRATVPGMRLRCRAHNQYEAERTFGVDFMRHKRAEAPSAAEAARTQATERERVRKRAAEEVIPWLRALGFRADEARRAAARCETIPDASLEQRVRLALRGLGPRATWIPSPGMGLEVGRSPSHSQ